MFNSVSQKQLSRTELRRGVRLIARTQQCPSLGLERVSQHLGYKTGPGEIKGDYMRKVSSELVYQGKEEFTRYRIQKGMSEGLGHPSTQNMLTSTPTEHHVVFPPLEMPFPPQLSISQCLLLLSRLSQNKKLPAHCHRTDCTQSESLRILTALLKFKLMEAGFYVFYYFIYVPLSSCHQNLQVSRVLPDHLQISYLMC